MFHPLYKLLLARPHKDKRDMENLLSAAAAAQEQIRDFVIVRCSFMTNGPVYGEAKVRVGTEEKPEVGYTISREDVGKWIFDSVVKDEGRERWAGVKVCLTY